MKTAQGAVLAAIEELPAERRSMNQLAIKLGLASSVHLTWLLRDGDLTPMLERTLVFNELLEPRPEPVPTEPCHICAEVHRLDFCTHIFGEPATPKSTKQQRAQRIRRPRFSVAADNIEMAQAQLEKYYPGVFILNVLEKD